MEDCQLVFFSGFGLSPGLEGLERYDLDHFRLSSKCKNLIIREKSVAAAVPRCVGDTRMTTCPLIAGSIFFLLIF